MWGKTKIPSQTLKQMLVSTFVPNIPQDRMYQTIDIYTRGTTQLYSFDPPNFQGSLGQSRRQANYIKKFPNGDKLKVHAPNGIITGAKFNDKPINNYQAAMHDLRDGIIKKNTGGE